jgi:hypothetical protein
MVQTAQDRMHYHPQVPQKLVSMYLQRSRQMWRRVRDAWPQEHMGTPLVVVWHPLVQETSQVRLGERHQKIQPFPPQRADEPLANGVGLRALWRCFQDS